MEVIQRKRRTLNRKIELIPDEKSLPKKDNVVAFCIVPSKEFPGLIELKKITMPRGMLQLKSFKVEDISEADTKQMVLSKLRIAAFKQVEDLHAF